MTSLSQQWLQLALPAEEYAQLEGLPVSLLQELYPSICSYGPNGELVQKFMDVATNTLLVRLSRDNTLSIELPDILNVDDTQFKEIIPDDVNDNLLTVWVTNSALPMNFETAIFFAARVVAAQAFMPREEWRTKWLPLYHRYLTYFHISLTDYIMPSTIGYDLTSHHEK